eukprot:gene14186-biopygen1022
MRNGTAQGGGGERLPGAARVWGAGDERNRHWPLSKIPMANMDDFERFPGALLSRQQAHRIPCELAEHAPLPEGSGDA